MCIYPSYISNQETLTIIFNSYPALTLEAIGIDLETCFTPVGYYCFILRYITLLAAIEAAIIGAKVITSENKNSFLYTKPIKRKTILTSNLLAGLFCLVITNIVYSLVSCITMAFLTKVDYTALLLLNLGLFLLQITFASVIMMFASFVKKQRTISLISYITIFGFYTLSIIENIVDNVILRYINPFSYFEATTILKNGGFNKGFIIASIFIVFYMINFSYIHNNELEM